MNSNWSRISFGILERLRRKDMKERCATRLVVSAMLSAALLPGRVDGCECVAWLRHILLVWLLKDLKDYPLSESIIIIPSPLSLSRRLLTVADNVWW